MYNYLHLRENLSKSSLCPEGCRLHLWSLSKWCHTENMRYMAEHMIDILRDLEALKKWDELINTRLERRSLNNTRGVQTLNYVMIELTLVVQRIDQLHKSCRGSTRYPPSFKLYIG